MQTVEYYTEEIRKFSLCRISAKAVDTSIREGDNHAGFFQPKINLNLNEVASKIRFTQKKL